MDGTLKAFSDELKKTLQLDKGKRLKAGDWESVYTISFNKEGNFALNDNHSNNYKVKWDLHHVFKFTNIRTLYISNLPDITLFTAGGIDSFDFKFWFNKFENLNGLYLKLGAHENSREARCYKVKLKDKTSWILHCNEKDGHSVEIWTEEGKQKSFFFGDNKKKSQEWFMNILEYLLSIRELPSEIWYDDLKAKNTEKSFRERNAIVRKVEDKPEIKESLY
jgi:hypothetical protein